MGLLKGLLRQTRLNWYLLTHKYQRIENDYVSQATTLFEDIDPKKKGILPIFLIISVLSKVITGGWAWYIIISDGEGLLSVNNAIFVGLILLSLTTQSVIYVRWRKIKKFSKHKKNKFEPPQDNVLGSERKKINTYKRGAV